MRSVAISPPYTPLTQQRMCCVPCAVQWVLLRRKLPIFTQEEIGMALHLTVPPRYKKLYVENVRVSAKTPHHGWGTQTMGEELFNDFFRKRKLPLRVAYFPYSKLKKPETLIESSLKKGSDVMIIIFMGVVDKKYRWGHALLVSRIARGKESVITVGDPNFIAAKFYDVPLETLLKGMTKKHGKTERGLYIFSRRRISR